MICSALNVFTEYVTLGNLDSKRDWGHAKDYVEGMWMMMQQDEFVTKYFFKFSAKKNEIILLLY